MGFVKKTAILFLGIILLATLVMAWDWVFVSSQPVTACNDIDGGLNAEEASFTAFKNASYKFWQSANDYCEGDMLYEYTCGKFGASLVKYKTNCSQEINYTCQYGACV